MIRKQKEKTPTKADVIQQEARLVWREVAASVAGALGATTTGIPVMWADKISDMYIDRYLGNRQSGKDINGNKL